MKWLQLCFTIFIVLICIPLADVTAQIVIGNTDGIWKAELTPSRDLTIVSQTVSSRVITEYADSSFSQNLTESKELIGIAKSVPPRVIAEYADTFFSQNLRRPISLIDIAKTASPRIITEYANSYFSQNLRKPEGIESIAKAVPPRIIVEYADSSLSFNLKPLSGKIQPTGIKGDVNGDGNIKSNDAILTLRISAGLMTPTDRQIWTADMNGDGNVRANDAILILRKAAGLGAPLKDILANAVNHVTVALGEIHGISGESITVPVKIDNTDMVAGGDICITYDSSVLMVADVSSDSGTMLASNISESGKIKIAFATMDKLNSKTLANIKFDVLTDKVSPLILQSVELYSHDATPINSEKVNGRFSSWAIAPERSALLQNFPNPFNPDTWIPYQLKEGGDVKIWIYNVSGELVRKLELGYKPAGLYTSRDRATYWDGKDELGVKVASGIYFYRIQAKGFSEVKKMIVLK
ncbi:MAG: cohesin domain-containing protein [Proteobacteria bacterium]|nr:cohesin domain-containing protein [Pseudomonadota bacterium]